MNYGIPIYDIRATSRHVPMLRLQRGGISSVTDPKEWMAAYRQALIEDWKGIKPYLPQKAARVLDVGSGLGGLSLMIQRYYKWGRGGTESWLLDGTEFLGNVDEEPDHDVPFNDALTTHDFWRVNGEKPPIYVPAERPVIEPEVMFDVVVSTQAWSFHFEPKVYLDLIAEHTHSNTVIIIDVRKGKPDWLKQLEKHWRADHVIWDRPKYRRIIWRMW